MYSVESVWRPEIQECLFPIIAIKNLLEIKDNFTRKVTVKIKPKTTIFIK